MSARIRVLIVDDHPIFRQGLRQVVEADPLLQVIGEAGDGLTALEMIQAAEPDVAVVDVHMPRMGGLELARNVKEKRIHVALVFLTMYKDEAMFNHAMDIGVKGYVLKDSAITDITTCIKAVAAGEPYITPSLSQYLLNRGSRSTSFTEHHPGISALTKTERRILKLIAEDKTSREIAAQLFIHPRTVDNHRTNICQKLNLHGSHALLRFALTHKSELGGE